MGIKDLLGMGEDKGIDCTEDPETGKKICRVMIRHKNQLLATGSSFSGGVDPKTCKFNFTDRTTILEDDEPTIAKEIRREETQCRGGIN